jgi:peptidoglycan/LPS O-acetylase OafA/YrhL
VPTLAPSAPDRFEGLDGCRGLAALIVLVAHLRFDWLVPHYYLQVDLFFAISGFVLVHAYQHRLATGMSPAGFVLLRIRRLWPLLACGVLLTALVRLPLEGWRTGLPGLVQGLLLIPGDVDPLGWNQDLIRFDPPGWSLLFEFWINVAFAFALHRADRRWLATLLLVSGLGLSVAVWKHNGGSFGSQWMDGLSGGWRASFQFLVGMLLARGWVARPALVRPTGMLTPLAAVGAIALLPAAHGVTRIVDLAIMMALVPLIVVAAANARPSGTLAGLCRLAGRLSYPLYITQSVFMAVNDQVRSAGLLSPAGLLLLRTAMLPCAVALAWFTLRWIDEPLQARFRAARPRLSLAAA